MKPIFIVAICGILAVYGQSSNETVVEVVATGGNSTEVVSAEIPDASVAVVEPVEAKQTVSVQSAEKPIAKSDDDNSNLIASAVDSSKSAMKDASESVANAADSAKNTVNTAADNLSRKASEISQSAEHAVSGGSTFIASSLVLAIAFFNSIQNL